MFQWGSLNLSIKGDLCKRSKEPFNAFVLSKDISQKATVKN